MSRIVRTSYRLKPPVKMRSGQPWFFWKQIRRIHGVAEVRAEQITRPNPPQQANYEWQPMLPL